MSNQTRKIPSSPGEIAVFKAKALKPGLNGAPHEFGRRENGNLELLVQLNITEIGLVRTTPLYFTPDAAPYSWERLRALGMKSENIADLTGIDTNEVDVEASCTSFEGKTQVKWQILTGGGTFKTSNPISPAEFAALLQAGTGKGGSTGAGGAPEPPPF
jgi:hypothetical protein